MGVGGATTGWGPDCCTACRSPLIHLVLVSLHLVIVRDRLMCGQKDGWTWWNGHKLADLSAAPATVPLLTLAVMYGAADFPDAELCWLTVRQCSPVY